MIQILPIASLVTSELQSRLMPRSVLHVGSASDEALMAAYVSGSDEAFEEIFRRYLPSIHGMVRRLLRSDELATEITQQTFFQLHNARNDFRAGAKLRPWVVTIAMNLVRQHWRTQTRRPTVELDDGLHADSNPEMPMIEREREQQRQAVHAAVAELPTSQREVIELYWFGERSYAEVAEILGTTEGAVRVRAHRACDRLRATLGPEWGGG